VCLCYVVVCVVCLCRLFVSFVCVVCLCRLFVVCCRRRDAVSVRQPGRDDDRRRLLPNAAYRHAVLQGEYSNAETVFLGDIRLVEDKAAAAVGRHAGDGRWRQAE
jgi:hypothetical protein